MNDASSPDLESGVHGRRARARSSRWLRRLQTRVMLALLCFGILAVGASGYLVQLTIRYFDELGASQAEMARDVVAHSEVLYAQLVTTSRAHYRLRAEGLATDIRDVWMREVARGADDETGTGAQDGGMPELVPSVAPSDRARSAIEALLRNRHEDDVARLVVRRGDDVVARVDDAGTVAGESQIATEVTVPIPSLTDWTLVVRHWVPVELTAEVESLGRLRGSLDTVVVDGARVDREQVVRAVVVALATATGLVFVIALTAGVLVARTVTRRVSEVSAVMRRVARGDVRARAGHHGHDEIGQLAADLNAMLDELGQARSKVAYLERIGAWQDIARRIAHEIKNPLTPISLVASQLRHEGMRLASGADARFERLLRDSVDIIDDEVAVIRRLVSSFSQFARLPEVRLEPVDVGGLLDEFERAYGHFGEGDHEHDRLDVLRPDAPVLLSGDRQLLKQVLVNLVENAVLSVRERGTGPVHVRVSVVHNDDATIELHVDDNGPGVDPSRRDEVFEPYVTTREQGTGLGLAIVKKIVLDHGGEIWIVESDLGGASIRLRLPIDDTSAR